MVAGAGLLSAGLSSVGVASDGQTPDSEPQRFGLGRPATPGEIAAVDRDVRPDGTGLPPGSGSVQQGEAIYAEKCVVCHGDRGEGGLNDRLVGREPRDHGAFSVDPGARKTIGNYWPYATTLFDYTWRSMPFTEPGTLRPDEVYALVAYLLYLNEIVDADAVMTRATLPDVAMPARDRFVMDDRRGGAEIRD